MNWQGNWQADWMAEWFGPAEVGAGSIGEGTIIESADELSGTNVYAQAGGGGGRLRKVYDRVPNPLVIIPSRGAGLIVEVPDRLSGTGTSTPWHLTPAGQQEEEALLLLVA